MITIPAIEKPGGSKGLPEDYLVTYPQAAGKPSGFDGTNYYFFETTEEEEVFKFGAPLPEDPETP